MGVIYEARHIVLPRRAIIKVRAERDVAPVRAAGTIPPGGLPDPSPSTAAGRAAVQLLREACILEALEHPGVVRVYESGLLPDRRPWFAHERVDGATVSDLLAHGPLDPAHASALLRDIAEVLEHAHRRGVINTGLRPERIAVTGRTRGFPLCIIDWSDARTHDTSAPPPPLVFPDYAAPELVNGEVIDDRADVFALGVIGYRALTGELPFDGVWVATVGESPAQVAPTSVGCPEAPAELANLVDEMLAWDRWDRPSSAEAFADLAAIAAELAPPAPLPPSGMRIRKPKWTPALPLGDGLPDIVADDVSDDKPEP
jgi:serine/threonine-protein kinase